MRLFVVKPITFLEGKIILSGDKSIAHRSVILSALANGVTLIKNFPLNKDCLSTLKAFNKLGISSEVGKNVSGSSSTLKIYGKGLFGLKEHKNAISVGDSGTTLRLLLGVLAGQNFRTKLIAGKSLGKRPMLRVTQPLRMMGAVIKSKIEKRKSKMEEFLPIIINGGALKAICYKMPVASAQVKSAILLAGLYAKGETKVIEKFKTRDHTERMLKLFKANIKIRGNIIELLGGRQLVSPKNIYIPGDISSASFFMVAAAILPGSRVTIKRVNLNPSRMGFVDVLKRMGADVNIKYQKSNIKNSEPIGDLAVKSSLLTGTRIKKEEVASLIDELPVLMVAASLARGRSVFEAVGELRFKETDRIRSMSENLSKMGADVVISKSVKEENIIITGVKELKGAKVKSFGDHRTTMSIVVAGAAACGNSEIDDVSCIDKSFPDFLRLLGVLCHYKGGV